MLRIGMRTLNGKSRQTAVAAFVRMPEPPCLITPFVVLCPPFLPGVYRDSGEVSSKRKECPESDGHRPWAMAVSSLPPRCEYIAGESEHRHSS